MEVVVEVVAKFQSTRLHEARHFQAIVAISNELFQSTRLHEARQDGTATCECLMSFQSTRLHEARPQYVRTYLLQLLGFNPRAYMRRDNLNVFVCEITSKFQSTRLHEARPFRIEICDNQYFLRLISRNREM